jgi:hypothetical protein
MFETFEHSSFEFRTLKTSTKARNKKYSFSFFKILRFRDKISVLIQVYSGWEVDFVFINLTRVHPEMRILVQDQGMRKK